MCHQKKKGKNKTNLLDITIQKGGRRNFFQAENSKRETTKPTTQKHLLFDLLLEWWKFMLSHIL